MVCNLRRLSLLSFADSEDGKDDNENAGIVKKVNDMAVAAWTYAEVVGLSIEGAAYVRSRITFVFSTN
jgi:hypothetical protein